MGALFGPKRSRIGPGEDAGSGKLPLRRRKIGSGYAGLGNTLGEEGFGGGRVILRAVFGDLVFWSSAARKPPLLFGD